MILKLDGSYMNWPKFWGQYTEAIDKSSIAPITKFTYLLELLEPNTKRCIEALPFTPEGYNRAKAILVDKYGKECKGLCFNCDISVHRAAYCPSKTACSHCNKRHHTSICDKKIAQNDENSNGAKLLMDGVSGDNVFCSCCRAC